MTLTTRLSLFFLSTLALVLLGFSLTLYLIAYTYLHHQSDERLDSVMNTLVASVDVGPQKLDWEPHERHLNVGPAALGDQVMWLVHDDLNQMRDHSKQSEIDDFVGEASRNTATHEISRSRVDWRTDHWQFSHRWILPAKRDLNKAGSPTPAMDEEGRIFDALSITAAVPLGPLNATLNQLALALTGLSSLIWLLALFAGRFVSRRALLPVAQMAKAARLMDGTDLEQRLPSVNTSDELEDLNRAFNSLLARLHVSFERQRRFTGDASHQLRTPLAAILGQIEVALRRERPSEEYQRVLITVQKRAEHLGRIVESLLFLARADNESLLPGRQQLDVVEWLPERLRLWAEHPRQADIQLEIAIVGPIFVRVQPELLSEILNILFDNACKFSKSGSPIVIGLRRSADAVDLSVRDDGCGIDPSDLEHLFTPFFRSADARRRGIEGLGLGLSIAKRLADACGGVLSATSIIGTGSCFALELPLDEQT